MGQQPVYGAQPNPGWQPQDGPLSRLQARQEGFEGLGMPQVHGEPRRDPTGYVLASFFIPGLGSLLNEDIRGGLTIMGIHYLTPFVFLAVLFFGMFSFGSDTGMMVVGISTMVLFFVVYVGTWIWGMIEAYKRTKEHNEYFGYE